MVTETQVTETQLGVQMTEFHLIMKSDRILTKTILSFRYLLVKICGLYYKDIMIVNDDSSIINKFVDSLTDAARVVIYDCSTGH